MHIKEKLEYIGIKIKTKKIVVWLTIVFILIIYSLFAQETNDLIKFDSKAAIKESNDILSEHWKNYYERVSRYYGGFWFDNYAKQQVIGERTCYDDYLKELKKRDLKRIRMDCTLYSAKVLKAGMGSEEYSKLVGFHDEIWPGKGFAGWSVGHLLVDRFGWKAYAFIEPGAKYYHHYLSHFKDKKEYPVWRQPNIKIEDYFILGKNDSEIEELLRKHKFSWGFSE
ncbi:MAG: hypothetical protein U9N34_10610, partial [Candidatus Cloacimonadota bacterium]|nr:hypothetical protein [Candidatus Cloacimonadota bacterium]